MEQGSAEEPAKVDPFIAEIEYLNSLTDEQRTPYIQGVISSIGNSLLFISQQRNPIKKLKEINTLGEDLTNKAPTILPAIVMAVRPEYRDQFLSLFTNLAKLLPKK